MTLTLELPRDLEEKLTSEASRLGLPLETYALRLLRDQPSAGEGSPVHPLPPISLKLANVSPASTWPREEIYGDDGR